MKYRFTIPAALAALALSAPLMAQNDGSEVILPLEAQTCNLPVAPASIPAEPTYDDLVKAKGNVNDFQARLAAYRTCLQASETSGALTDGNQLALNQAHNYSVEMEERVAEQFNVAVRAYKASQDK
jgi:hypothetical protein